MANPGRGVVIQMKPNRMRLLKDTFSSWTITFYVLYRPVEDVGGYTTQATLVYNVIGGNNAPTVEQFLEGLIPEIEQYVIAASWTPTTGTIRENVEETLYSIPWGVNWDQATKRVDLYMNGQHGPMIVSRN